MKGKEDDMDFCVICGEQFKKGNDILAIPRGHVTSDNGRNYSTDNHVVLHYLCFLGLIEAVKEAGDE